jgi:tRNA A-37 threonylcarbamoyl transferase component Bud32
MTNHSVPGTNCYILELDGQPVLYKSLNEPLPLLLAKQLEFVFLLKHMYLKVPALREKELVVRDKSTKEIATLTAWRTAGITVPEVLTATRCGIAYRYIRSVSFKALLSGAYKPEKMDRLLYTYAAIRRVARSHRNIDLLHSDCHLDNFLYDADRDIAIPIDPGVRFMPHTKFDTADASLNLFFAFSFFTLDTDSVNKERYLQAFASTLEESDRITMIKLNKEVPGHIHTYFKFRELIPRVIKRRHQNNIIARYCHENVRLLNEILRQV